LHHFKRAKKRKEKEKKRVVDAVSNSVVAVNDLLDTFPIGRE